MNGQLMVIICGGGGVAVAGLLGAFLEDAGNVSRLGLVGFMALCIVVLVAAVCVLARFVAKCLIPLKTTLQQLADSTDAHNKVLVEVKDTINRCKLKNE